MTDNEIIKALESEVKSAEYVDSYYCNGVDLTLIKSAIDLINRQKAEYCEKQRQKIKKKRKVGKAHGETPVIICQRLIVHAGAERGNGKIRNSSRNRRVSQNMRFWFTCGGKRATILRRRLRKTQRLIFYVNRKR